jgi:hypothetical protein
MNGSLRKEVESTQTQSVTESATIISDFTHWVNQLGMLPLVVERAGRRLPAMVISELMKEDVVMGLAPPDSPMTSSSIFSRN